MTQTAIQAVEAMVAPVVLITMAAILSGGLLGVYAEVNDRMRSMNAERMGILTGPDDALRRAGDVPPALAERLAQIDHQLPHLLRRHHLLHNAVLMIDCGIAVLVLSVITIGVAVTLGSGVGDTVAMALVLAATATVLSGLVLAARALMISQDAIDYEVSRVMSLGS